MQLIPVEGWRAIYTIPAAPSSSASSVRSGFQRSHPLVAWALYENGELAPMIIALDGKSIVEAQVLGEYRLEASNHAEG